MKTLQNNFTTPEQSKRLLELGVPADSADCVYELKQNGTQFTMSKTPDIIPISMRLSWRNNRIPCWSVGRLIEIWEVVTGEKWLHETEQPIIEELISNFNYYSYDNDDPLDFSKLEE